MKDTSRQTKPDIFDGLSRSEQAELRRAMVTKKLAVGQELYRPFEKSEVVYVVLEGAIRIYQLSYDGRKFVVDILGPGAIFGDVCPGCNWSFSLGNYVEAAAPTVVGQWAKERFLDFITRHPKAALLVIGDLNYRLHHLDFKTKSIVLNDAEKRVLAELLMFAKEFGRQTKTAYVINQRLTHEVIAAMVGTTRETVTYALNSLRRQKVIKITPERQIWVIKNKVASNF